MSCLSFYPAFHQEVMSSIIIQHNFQGRRFLISDRNEWNCKTHAVAEMVLLSVSFPFSLHLPHSLPPSFSSPRMTSPRFIEFVCKHDEVLKCFVTRWVNVALCRTSAPRDWLLIQKLLSPTFISTFISLFSHLDMSCFSLCSSLCLQESKDHL